MNNTRKEKPVKAQWYCTLDVECPKCGEDFDHMLLDDWHYGWDCERIEVARSGDGFSTNCPHCDHEFYCVTVY